MKLTHQLHDQNIFTFSIAPFPKLPFHSFQLHSYMFTLYKYVLTLLPRYTFRNSVKILGKNGKFQTDQYLEFHEQE